MFRSDFDRICIAVPSLTPLALTLLLSGGCFQPPGDAVDATANVPGTDAGSTKEPSELEVVTYVRTLAGDPVALAGVAVHDLQSPTPYSPVIGTWSDEDGAALLVGRFDMPAWYVSASALGYAETHTFYPNADFSELDGRTTWLLSDKELGELAFAVGRRVENGSWTVVRVVDGRGLPVAGARVSSEDGDVLYLGDTKGTGDDGLAVIFDAPEGPSMISATDSEDFQLHAVAGDDRFGAGLVVRDPLAVTFVEIAIH